MFKSLWFKLVGAFAAVIAVMVVVVAVVANAATARQFDRYVVDSGQVWAQALAPRLAEEYAAQGDWSGAQDLLTSPLTQRAVVGGDAEYGQGGQGQGAGQGQGLGQGQGPGLHAGMQGMMGPASPGDVWGRVGMRLVLADAGNTVVADTGQTMIGEHLSAQVIQQGTAVEVDGQQVGTLLLVNPVDTSPLRLAFLQATSRAVLLAGLAAGAVALAMGTLLFVIITRPLRQLQTAAQTLAGGEMGTRVPVPLKG